MSAPHGTWLTGFLGHCILVPLCTTAPFPLLGAIALLCKGQLLAGAVLLGILAMITFVKLPYQPWLVKMFYDLDLPRYYRRCEICGPHLGALRKERTLYLFHPHGVLSAGFTINGCWGRAFNTLTAEKDLDPSRPRGTTFLIASNLREYGLLFKVLCDLSGRLESATKSNIMRLMRSGRNVAIIPGGFEDATLHALSLIHI